MKQHRSLSSTMETRDHLENGASLKSLMSRGYILVNIEFFLLMFFFLLTGCSNFTPIDVNSNNLEEHVLIEANKQLDRAVKFGVIKQYQQEPIQTSAESFKTIVQKYVDDGATLHPNLTYKIKYLGGTITDSEKECEAMAYSVVKDGKLCGCGVVCSEAISRAWSKTWTIGGVSKDTGVNWPVWIGFILLMLMSPFLIRLFGGTLRLKQPQNRCPRCGNICPPHYRHRADDGGAFWHCLKCNKIWEE